MQFTCCCGGGGGGGVIDRTISSSEGSIDSYNNILVAQVEFFNSLRIEQYELLRLQKKIVVNKAQI
jgi:hypothetical protein